MADQPARNFRITSMAAYRQELFDNWPSDWPSQEFHAIQHDVTVVQYQEFADLVHGRSGERVIEAFLRKNRQVLALTVSMFSTGHHMSWIFPKQQIRPPSEPIGGMIPDYILAGASSGGVQWFVLELKGADTRALARRGKRVSLSAEANAEYLSSLAISIFQVAIRHT